MNQFEFKKFSKSEYEIDLISKYYFEHINLTKEKFMWKHLQNNFGTSNIYYAMDRNNGNIAAARTLWQQKIVYNNKLYTALQPCDTITSPDYQRLGLFSKLTQIAINDAKDSNYFLINNFPNIYSKPGYLKLNFQDISGIESFIYFNKLKISIYKNILSLISKAKYNIFTPVFVSSERMINIFDSIDIFNDISYDRANTIQPFMNKEYFEWRFIKRPDSKYYYSIEGGIGVIYQIGIRGRIKEIRIVFWKVLEKRNNPKILLNFLLNKHDIDIISTHIHVRSIIYPIIKSVMSKFRTKANFVVYPLDINDIDFKNINWDINSCYIDTF